MYISVLTFIVSSGIQCRDRLVWLLVCMFFFSWWIKVKFDERSWQVLAWWCHGDDWRG